MNGVKVGVTYYPKKKGQAPVRVESVDDFVCVTRLAGGARGAGQTTLTMAGFLRKYQVDQEHNALRRNDY